MIVIRGEDVMEGLSECSCYVRTSYAMSILLSEWSTESVWEWEWEWGSAGWSVRNYQTHLYVHTTEQVYQAHNNMLITIQYSDSPFHFTRSKGVSSWPPDSSTCRAKDWQALTSSKRENTTIAPLTLAGRSSTASCMSVAQERTSSEPSIIVAVATILIVGSWMAL